MGSPIRQHSGSVLLSVALHAAVFAAFAFGIDFRPQPRELQGTVIQAAIVDPAALARTEEARAEAERRAREEAERRAREEEQRRLQAEREAAERAEQERLAEEARQRAEAEERERQEQARLQREREEQARREEAERQARAEAERQAREEAERQARAEAERRAREEAERKRREEEERRRQEELERQRLAEEERKRREAEEAARRQAELEAQLASELAAEEERLQAMQSGELDEYTRLIQNRIEQNWFRPATARPGIDCEVHVTQIPSGEVISARVVRCNGDDAVVRSIEAAVLRASPLPLPSNPALFERNLVIRFVPDE
ncbi:MAG TPA: cell envelope integrity protein TolA [Gammaproteobacteria bacterium]